MEKINGNEKNYKVRKEWYTFRLIIVILIVCLRSISMNNNIRNQFEDNENKKVVVDDTATGVILGIIALAIITLFGVIGYLRITTDKRNYENNPKIEATITDIGSRLERDANRSRKTKRRRTRKITTANIEYVVDGVKYEEVVDYPSLKKEDVGKKVTVAYDKKDPSKVYIKHAYGSFKVKFAFGFIIVMFVLLTGYIVGVVVKKVKKE